MQANVGKADQQANIPAGAEPAPAKSPEPIGFTIRHQHPRVEGKLWISFYIFRLASLALTSALYFLLDSSELVSVRITTIVLIFIHSHLMLFVYSRAIDNPRRTAFNALVETVSISLLLVVTGGMTSPFIWYALNPIVISSIYLQPLASWLYLAFYFTVIAVEDIFISLQNTNLSGFFLDNVTLLMVLALVTLALQVLSRVSSTLSEQSQMLKQQQDELYSAFSSLSENHHMAQALSEYQRETVASRDEKDIFLKLTTASESCFPFTRSAVLLFEKSLQPIYLSPRTPYVILSHSEKVEEAGKGALQELADRWQDFAHIRMLTGKNRDWLSMPIWLDRRSVKAVYLAWIRPGTNLSFYPGNLSFFIYYTEQVMGSLLNLKRTEGALQHMSSLYEAVETISSRDDIKEVIDLFAAYARALTGCEKAIFWVDQVDAEGTESSNFIYTVKGQRSNFQEKYWYPQLLKAWSQMKDNPKPMDFEVEKPGGKSLGRLICVPVKSRSRVFGLLAVLQSETVFLTEDLLQTLTFLANLAAVSIERNLAELFSDKMLLIEEQNRIANEIHDSVSQNLFSVVYGVDALIKQAGTLPLEIQKQLLSTIRDVAAQTSKELRLLIYRLSPRHRGDDTFVQELQAYLNNLAELNQVAIEFNVEGKEEYMNSAMRRAFYRILKEATSNALRHGRCTEIRVDLEISPFVSNMTIRDNGSGFEPEPYLDRSAAASKLGLINMQEMAMSLKGDLRIESKKGEGTTVFGSVPTAPVA